ncbi:MAG: DNA-directed RNA polymerase subunit beta' [Candidatus Paceibacterota bacterium]
MSKANIKDIDFLSIKVASPEKILSWSHGEVIKPETLNYRTQRPEKDGLFSERIFGPTKDYECYCGKYKKVRYKGVVCERCGVEVTRSNVRRERMGHIELAAPVVHIWFLKTIPSRVGLLLNTPVSKLERVVYYAAYIVTEVDEESRKRAMQNIKEEFKSKKAMGDDEDKLRARKKKIEEILKTLKKGMILSEDDYFFLSERFGDVFEAGRGAESLKKILETLDLKKISKNLKEEVDALKDITRKKKVIKRLELVNALIESGTKPEWLVMTVIPVLPPDLRPMVPLDGGRYATADLNDLYRRVINRNNRLKKLMDLKSPDVILTNEKRMLQEAVDALIDNTKRSGGQVMSSRKRPLKSLADMLKGKQGRFRQNLLGKRVDYSGRSVIVVGPELALNECGLPKNLALEIFRPFIIGQILKQGLAYNIKQANRFIEQGTSEVWAILEEVIKDKMVLLNRAPTLHRLGIQAFKVVLIEDLAIRVHPLVCPAFNADFDGDQMAVHLPLTAEAQFECRTLMDAGKNLLKPASGDPIVSPTQGIVLGTYYLTEVRDEKEDKDARAFSSTSELDHAHEAGLIELGEEIRVMMDGKLTKTTYGRIIFNKILPDGYEFVNKKLDKKGLSRVISNIIDNYGIERSSKCLDDIKNLGFKYATLASYSMGAFDAQSANDKPRLIKVAEKEVSKIEDKFDEGLLTDEERKERVIEVWTGVNNELRVLTPKSLDSTNPIFSIIDSKARGNWAQLNQIAGMKGLVASPKGDTIELPIKSSYNDGLGVLEYFISTHGARKGLTDTALKTASAGYLTRRLVDVCQDLSVKEKNCRTTAGIDIKREEGKKFNYQFSARLYSRTSLEDITIDRKKIVKKGEVITRAAAEKIEASEIESVKVRSPITCKTLYGVCSDCYGWDLSKEEPVEIGEAVGIVAAQSIGEPGTQLTMRTFHTGGMAGVDITQGLPRVEELFEVRNPKGKAMMTSTDGKIDYIEERGLVVAIGVKTKGEVKKTRGRKPKSKKKEGVVEYLAPKGAKILVKEGEEIEKGQLLSEGRIDPREMLSFRGDDELKRYIINEVQKVYVTEGAVINDKHVEIIVRQMLSRVIIKEPGDSNFLIGELVDRSKFREVNKAIKKKKGKKAKATRKVLGITKVALTTESFLSAASFQETSRVLVNASVEGKVDNLRGLKENVIIGKLIPAGTGIRGIPEDQLILPEEHEEFGEK